MKETFEYEARGYVYGSLWDNSEGAYSARWLEGTSLKDILEQATKGLDGSLDSGMGFQKLYGALLYVTTRSIRIIEGKTFTHSETKPRFVGKLTPKQKKFLKAQY